VRWHLCLIASVICLVACDYNSIESISRDRASAEDTINRGWLPQALPSTAFDIRESHSIDTNHGEGEFMFLEVERSEFLLKLEPLSEEPQTSCRLPWAELKKAGRVWYRTGKFYLAVHSTVPHVEFRLCGAD